jgi:hypothetical protein
VTTWHRCVAALLVLTPALYSLNAAEAILSVDASHVTGKIKLVNDVEQRIINESHDLDTVKDGSLAGMDPSITAEIDDPSVSLFTIRAVQ